MQFTRTFGLLKQATNEWIEDNALRRSAALAYYSIFSIAPLLVIAVAIASWFFGREAAQGYLGDQLRSVAGDQVTQGVLGMVKSASKPSSSILAGIIGVITLLVGASGVFVELKQSLNQIWKVKAKPGQGMMQFIREQILSFGMVLVIGFILLVSLVLTTVLSALGKYFGSQFPLLSVLVPIGGFVLSFGVAFMLFAAIFKLVPDVEVQWRHVWIGAAVTGLLFEVGKFLLGLYLGRATTASMYGAAASAVLLLMWVYYSSMIMLYGAEFTQVYARVTGSRVEPASNTESLIPSAHSHQQSSETVTTQLSSPIRATSKPLEPSQPAPKKESPRLAFGPSLVARHRTQGSLFIENQAIPLLIGAVGTGLVIGLIIRRWERRPTATPVQQIAEGSRGLAFAGAAATIAFASRLLARLVNILPKGTLRKETKHAAKRADATAADLWSHVRA